MNFALAEVEKNTKSAAEDSTLDKPGGYKSEKTYNTAIPFIYGFL